ncbi:enoyl-CoA hydratase/isomerase family protein [Actinomadura madurae]
MNAVNADLSAAVGAALDELDADAALSVGIVTGAGRAFCAGADLKAVRAGQSVLAPGREDWGFVGSIDGVRTSSSPRRAADRRHPVPLGLARR